MSKTQNNIAFGNVANALKSIASDHILAIAEDIYDVRLGKYQSEINASIPSDVAPADHDHDDVYSKLGHTHDVATRSASGFMSATDKTKLDGISSGAEVNVQSDWSVTNTSSDAYIKNKPTIPTIPSNNVTGSGTSGYLAKWSGTNTLTNGPAFGSDTTKFLRNDGAWAAPPAIHSGTAEINEPNTSVTPTVICSTLSTPTVGTRLQIKLSINYNTQTTLHIANITSFYLNNDKITKYAITKNGNAVTLNNVNTDGVLDLLFITDTSAELIYKSNTSINYVFYGTCSTAAATRAKTLQVTEPGFALVTGTKLVVDFINENTGSSPTLNVNGTGAKSIMYGDGTTNVGYIPAGPQLFVFYAENNDIANGVWKYTSMPAFIPSIYATCSTAAATSAKTASAFSGFTGFRLFKGAVANVKFTYANTANSSLTLNVASTGAKQVYYLSTNYGSSSPQSSYLTWDANSIVQFVYNGTYWIAVNNAYTASDSTPK